MCAGLNGTGASPVPFYEWRYEYYDDEEPVSYEGLKAHRYSIVIGFWVGLAVFVIFMFFLLTLLSKTGAPHPDSSQQLEKEQRLIGYMDTNLSIDAPPPPSHGLDTSCSVFHCYNSERWPTAAAEESHSSALEVGGAVLLQELAVNDTLTVKDTILLTDFTLPNFVGSEQSLSVGDDDLLLGGPELPIILEGRDQSHEDSKKHSDFGEIQSALR